MDYTLKELEEMKQIILIAIPKEISARDFYLNAAKKFKTQESIQLFLSLAEQEKGHEASLRKILKDIEENIIKIKNSK
ncbi:Rubrerythrin [Desulfurella multipotens]|uniref:Rubrerythrin n=1 Tax=Desulfurella multipotens TaxID=79269 RepID=A0A1G6MKH4_9BACT|nr:ferritin family protein [Desulfurella multipotens]SDC56019.1 Rubrerythrin [Desulfurella multipotens]